MHSPSETTQFLLSLCGKFMEPGSLANPTLMVKSRPSLKGRTDLIPTTGELQMNKWGK